jgi:radical SAM protein with 4Fe4S-binding SPASM domain
MDLARPDLPFALQVEITSHCNLLCKMCPLTTEDTASSVKPGHMVEAHLEEVLELAARVGEVIVAGFGEPLLSPRCLPFLQELDRRGVRTSLATNGTPLTPAIAKKLAAIPHLTQINVSIDSPDPEVYRRIRGGEAARALQGLTHLMAEIDKPERVTVSSVLMSENAASLVAFPSLLAGMGVKKYVLQGLVDYVSQTHDENLLYHQEALAAVQELQAECVRAGVELALTLPERLNLELRDPAEARSLYFGAGEAGGTRQCCLPWELPYIDKDGKVFPCCYAASEPGAVLGDLKESRLLDIWEGAAYQRFRRDILCEETLPAVCRGCTAARRGQHPLRAYAAELLFDRSVLDRGPEMRLAVRNVGEAAWTRDSPVRIGTTDPRGRPSAYYHRSWIDGDRVAETSEEIVLPGGTATFLFRVTRAPVPAESFQLLVEGKVWLPNTRFEIRAPGRPSLARRLVRWLRSRFSRVLKRGIA